MAFSIFSPDIRGLEILWPILCAHFPSVIILSTYKMPRKISPSRKLRSLLCDYSGCLRTVYWYQLLYTWLEESWCFFGRIYQLGPLYLADFLLWKNGKKGFWLILLLTWVDWPVNFSDAGGENAGRNPKSEKEKKRKRKGKRKRERSKGKKPSWTSD